MSVQLLAPGLGYVDIEQTLDILIPGGGYLSQEDVLTGQPSSSLVPGGGYVIETLTGAQLIPGVGYVVEQGAASGEQTLTPALYTNDQAFYSATVTTGGATQYLTPDLFSNSNTFGAATVSAVYGLSPSLFTNGQTFHAPVANSSYTLTAALVENTGTFYAPTISSGAVTLLPGLFTNTGTFPTHAIGEPANLAELVYKLLANRQELDPTVGVFRVYDDDDATVLFSAAAYEDAAGTVPYRGRGVSRIERLQ